MDLIENFPGSYVIPLKSNGTDTDRREVCPNCNHRISYGNAAERITDRKIVHLNDCRKWDW